jgi:hypothetical protein
MQTINLRLGHRGLARKRVGTWSMEATTQVRSAWLIINSVVSAPRVSYRDTVNRACDMQARSISC